MKKLALLGLSSALLLGSVQAANATVLTFDDHQDVQQNRNGHVGTYNGFNFSSNLDWLDTVDSSWNYGSTSGDFTLLNNYGGVGIITEENGEDFTFDGLSSRVWSYGSNRDVTIYGYNDGEQVWRSDFVITTAWADFAGMAGTIDELRLDLGNHFLVDDLYLNGRDGANVPESASLLLLGLGLAGFGMKRKKK